MNSRQHKDVTNSIHDCKQRLVGSTALICACVVALTLLAPQVQARPQQHPELIPEQGTVDMVGDVDGSMARPAKASMDTVWIATWNFEGCDDTGWVRSDNRILNDGNTYWSTNDNFSSFSYFAGDAAVLTHHDLCWATTDGYGNDWHQGIRMRYVGDSFLSFAYLVDSEQNHDFLQVETDSACASFGLVDYDVNPNKPARAFRDVVWSLSGIDTTTLRVDSLALGGYATLDTHCVFIAFQSDKTYSQEDGEIPTALGAAAVIDNLYLQGAFTTYESFTSFAPHADVDFVNMQDSTPFGQWARLFYHVTDNDFCTENPTCAWLATDDTTPTLANDPSMAFGPGAYVTRNWMDEVLVGPWVSLSTTPDAIRTSIEFNRFPGNAFENSRMVQNLSVRGRSRVANVDTPVPGDSIDCISSWGHAGQWNSLTAFRWVTSTWDMTADFDPNALDIQVRFRVSDWQYIAGYAAPAVLMPGPGPYWDRVRIGRQVLTGPVVDPGYGTQSHQAQDAAPNDTNFDAGPLYGPAPGGDIFGTSAFSKSGDLMICGNCTDNIVVGDSITVSVVDALGNGGLTIELYASIVAGPHAGKAPAPFTVGGNGFFAVTADSSRYPWNGVPIPDKYFVDLDDTYFRGGDVMLYYWWATDAMGTTASFPAGLTVPPANVAEAELMTGGLLEVSYLPEINWDPGYLARIQADAHGDLDPTPAEIANSSQANCILYYQFNNDFRRSGDPNRTSFMYTLDKLGYRGSYDVYDVMRAVQTNNGLGSRMSVEQARNYSLLVYDTGTRSWPLLPQGLPTESERLDMRTWFRDWNESSGGSNPTHTLWFISLHILEEHATDNDGLFADMGVAYQGEQGVSASPEIFGVANFANNGACLQEHDTEHFALHFDKCPPSSVDYDDAQPVGTGVKTHVYGAGAPDTPGAIVMNANAAGYNTIISTFPWADITAAAGETPTTADEELLAEILSCAVPVNCQEAIDPTGVDDDDVIAVPAYTALHQNTPNPFNPMTTIHFDLARNTHVSLRIFDVAGRLVRTLADETMRAGFDRRVTWDGRDHSGARVSSGVYFYRLEAGATMATRKLVVMK